MKRKEDFSKLTTAQFAALHEVNKRTLHYYDSIGLFSPKQKATIIIAITTVHRASILNIF